MTVSTFGKNAGLFHTCHRMSCVAAIEADGFRCGSFGYRTFYLPIIKEWRFIQYEEKGINQINLHMPCLISICRHGYGFKLKWFFYR